jgi:hypothetical protein
MFCLSWLLKFSHFLICYHYQFKRLNCLIFKENPVCKDENYLVTIYAYLRNLKYLDYELVSSAAVKAGILFICQFFNHLSAAF